MELIELPAEEIVREDISLKTIKHKPKVEVKKYEVESKEVSKNIQKFDNKVYTKDPYAYNSVSLKKTEVAITPTASQMATNPLYNAVGKILGIDLAREWNEYYDKVYEISEWARKKTKTDNIKNIVRFIVDYESRVPSFGSRRINDMSVFIGLQK
jgi:hypothetical protein